ncbi:hypothetical protein BDV95DRAFT_220046 [Massariosphaeria phaeospora]|uniref:Uncharacterized protein n=1 Tax=Massariosphaeria phaeospora TaxID=100035 RepID=A0A7C8MLH2_9PLEO|nr:hypothetical protein BDV95DRAFT_220046 [Massariosphaeria phaeospora]
MRRPQHKGEAIEFGVQRGRIHKLRSARARPLSEQVAQQSDTKHRRHSPRESETCPWLRAFVSKDVEGMPRGTFVTFSLQVAQGPFRASTPHYNAALPARYALALTDSPHSVAVASRNCGLPNAARMGASTLVNSALRANPWRERLERMSSLREKILPSLKPVNAAEPQHQASSTSLSAAMRRVICFAKDGI